LPALSPPSVSSGGRGRPPDGCPPASRGGVRTPPGAQRTGAQVCRTGRSGHGCPHWRRRTDCCVGGERSPRCRDGARIRYPRAAGRTPPKIPIPASTGLRAPHVLRLTNCARHVPPVPRRGIDPGDHEFPAGPEVSLRDLPGNDDLPCSTPRRGAAAGRKCGGVSNGPGECGTIGHLERSARDWFRDPGSARAAVA
jgi:hypothetical protein